MSRYQKILLTSFGVVWLWSAVTPVRWDGWLRENILVFIGVPLLLLLSRYFRLSDLSYGLITLFLVLHVIGAHYGYAEVPFGFTLQDWLGATRNMYDRLVHFSFGFLIAYPIREIFLRLAQAKGLWGYYFPFDVVLSLSAFYEILEWLAAMVLRPEDGLVFLGTQGDIWDAQKDMLAAAAGAALAMLIIAVLNWKYDPRFAREMRASFQIPNGTRPLGSLDLDELGKKNNKL